MGSNIIPYKRDNFPRLEGNDRIYFDEEFRKIEQTFSQIITLLRTPYEFSLPLSISSGVITIASSSASPISYIYVDTEAAGASDNLDTINWNYGVDGQIVIVWATDDARTVVLKDSVDNLNLAGDMTLDSVHDNITLQYFGGEWWELARANVA